MSISKYNPSGCLDLTAKEAIDNVLRKKSRRQSVNSKRKGANGEREFARLCKSNGYDCRRSQQYCGAAGDADVIGLPGIHIEVKRVERLNIEAAMAQGKRDARAGEMPIVAHRRNDCEWLVTMRAEDWFGLYRESHGPLLVDELPEE